jgi:beta-lactamase class D
MLKRSVGSIFYFLLFTFYFISCSPNNVTEDKSIGKVFDENHVTGSFGLFDNGQGHFTIYNLSRFRDSAYLPASTFKIANALIALKTGRVFDEKAIIKWDGITRERTEWNKDLSLDSAFRLSAVPHFQEIARRIGKDTMQIWLDSLGYGNKKIGNRVDSFWLNNTLKITADEQLGLVKRLYFEQLAIDKRPQRIVRKMMLQQSNANYQLSYKTGLGYRENGNAIGWIVGWIEENKHPYFFVLNIEGDHNMNKDLRLQMLEKILRQQGFYEGKK